MDKMRWHFPSSLTDLEPLLKLESPRLHGGGTGLLRNRPRSGDMIDLSECGFGGVEVFDDRLTIGGTATFADICTELASTQPQHVLLAALGTAATPGLRNRITAGGSVALFPPWSSIVGPLLATDAVVHLAGSQTTEVPLAEYIATREFRDRTVITGVTCSIEPRSHGSFFRFSRTRSNYPLFSITTLVELTDRTISRCRIVLTGTRGRYHIADELARSLCGKPPEEVTVSPSDLGTVIPDRQGFGSDYLGHRAAVAITRGIRSAKGGAV